MDPIGILTKEIRDLHEAVKDFVKSVAEVTDKLKQKQSNYKELMTNDTGDKEDFLWTKSRLDKFYEPKVIQRLTEAMDSGKTAMGSPQVADRSKICRTAEI